MKGKLIIRADGNSEIGFGHIMRSIALTEILNNDFDISFLTKCTIQNILEEIQKAAGEVHILNDDNEFIILESFLSNAQILVMDGEYFDENYQLKCRREGIRLVSIDDIHKTNFLADVIINHAYGVNAKHYKAENFTRYYLGPAYVLLRSAFLNNNDFKNINIVDTALICMGGSRDVGDFTKIALESCLAHDSIKNIHIVLGNNYSGKNNLENLAGTCSEKLVHFYSGLDQKEMINLMNLSQVAICSASTVAYEFCCFGGLLFPVKTVDNQSYVYDFLIQENLGLSLNNFADAINDPEIILQCIRNQRIYFDGKSPHRLKKLFSSILMEENVEVREASSEDLMDYFHLSNDNFVRQNSINGKSIDLESHKIWFSKKLNDNNSFLFTCLYQSQFMGQVRFDDQLGKFLISFSVNSKYRGKGLGEIMLQKAMFALLHKLKTSVEYIAFVKPDNAPSQAIFYHLGFENCETVTINNELLTTFSRKIQW